MFRRSKLVWSHFINITQKKIHTKLGTITKIYKCVCMSLNNYIDFVWFVCVLKHIYTNTFTSVSRVDVTCRVFVE